jgi:hypothetical protein
VTLHGGALDGVLAHLTIDPRAVPHLWATTDRFVVTVSGDLTRDQLIHVAESLEGGAGASPQSCRIDELSLSAGFQGSTGGLLGTAGVTNTGSRTCAIGGRPRVEIIGADGTPLELRISAEKPAFPPVSLRPGESAQAHLEWRNWCGGDVGALRVRVTLSGVGSLTAPLDPATATPFCNGPPSTLRVGWFRRD